MELLREMIALHDNRQHTEQVGLLLEYLGNLAVIDKSLVRSIRAGQKIYGGKPSKNGPQLNSSSKVEKKVASGKNTDQLYRFYDQNKEIVALVIEYDGEQVMALSDRQRLADPADTENYPLKPQMYTIASEEFFSMVMPEEEFNNTFGKTSYDRKPWRAVTADDKVRELKSGSSQARTFLRKLLSMMVEKAGKEHKDVSVLYIFKAADKGEPQPKLTDKTDKTGKTPKKDSDVEEE